MRTELGLNPSGFWLDMNDISNFIPGERDDNELCPRANSVIPPKVKKILDDTRYIPYSVGGDGVSLANKTLTISTKHYSENDGFLI